MTEIFISEKDMPKSCCECNFVDDMDPDHFCFANQNLINFFGRYSREERSENCPFQSLEKHDKELEKRLADRIYKLLESILSKKHITSAMEVKTVIRKIIED